MNLLEFVDISLLQQGYQIGLDWLGKFVRVIIESVGIIGVGIICFTLILKAVTLPFDIYQRVKTRKQTLIMREMKPELEKLQKQYANDKTTYNQKMMELYKKNGYSMLGACLPMIISLVILIVAFQAFRAYSQFANLDFFVQMSNEYNAAVLVNGGNVTTQEAAPRDPYEKMQKFCVVVDAGHGGKDPGKVGENGVTEQKINLEIALRLAALLRQADVKTVLTREDENGLYDEDASNKKVQDMKRRIARMEEADPDLVVSIHQNSYEEESVRGAQTFYYTESTQGQKLAESIQARLTEGLDPENHRTAKANGSYYLLKKTPAPIVIVECGFLSNPQEAQLLADPVYQERTAWQIHMGILQYLHCNDGG